MCASFCWAVSCIQSCAWRCNYMATVFAIISFNLSNSYDFLNIRQLTVFLTECWLLIDDKLLQSAYIRHMDDTLQYTLFSDVVARSAYCARWRTRRWQQRKRRRRGRRRRRSQRRPTASSGTGRNPAVSVPQRHPATPDTGISSSQPSAASAATHAVDRCAAAAAAAAPSRHHTGVHATDDTDRRRRESGDGGRDGGGHGGDRWRRQHGRQRRHRQQASGCRRGQQRRRETEEDS